MKDWGTRTGSFICKGNGRSWGVFLMIVNVHSEGKTYQIEAPDDARVSNTTGEDCLIFTHNGKKEYILTPFAVMLAREGEKGLRLISANKKGGHP